MTRLPGVPSIVNKIAQVEGRVVNTVLRKGSSVKILLRLLGVLNVTSRNCTGKRGGPMLGKGTSVTISLRQRTFTNFPRGKEGNLEVS